MDADHSLIITAAGLISSIAGWFIRRILKDIRGISARTMRQNIEMQDKICELEIKIAKLEAR
jgi:hypothetical protein